MTKIYQLYMSNIRRLTLHFLFLIIAIFFWTLNIKAQPEFSKEELRSIKQRGAFSDAFKYNMPQEKFPMSEVPMQRSTSASGGELDLSFNTSITEGFGYANKTLVQPDGKIIVVGLFQRANETRANGIARFNVDGTLDTSFNLGSGANAAVRAAALQSDGKIIVGGAFTTFNGQSISRIVRLNSNGSIDPTFSAGTTINGQVNDILILPDQKLLVGGAFNVSTSSLIRLNNDGTLDVATPRFNGAVNTISVAPGNKILVGGEFSTPKSSIARLKSDGALDSTFNPASGADDGFVSKIVVQPNGKILAGGIFTRFNGISTDSLVRLNDDATIDTTFEISSNPNVQFLCVYGLALQPDGKILAGFFNDGAESFADIKRFSPDGSVDLTFNTNSNNSLTTVDLNLLPDGKVLAAGYFVSFNDQKRLRLVKLNTDGSLDAAFNPALSTTGTLYAIKRQADGKILVGGDFEYVNGIRRSALARIDSDGSLDETFAIGAGFLGDIYAVEEQSDGKIIIGGNFGGNSAFPAFSCARLTANGSFNANLSNFGNKTVYTATSLGIQSDGKILIGGSIYNNSGSGSIAIIRVNPNASLDADFSTFVLQYGNVRAILIQSNGKIIVGGTFIATSTFSRAGLARLNNDGSLDGTVFSGNSNVASIKEQSDGSIIAGGSYLTKHSSEGVRDATFNTGGVLNGQIRAVETQPDGKVVLGGFFTAYNGNSVNRLIRVTSTGALDTSFTPNPSGTIFALNLQPGGKILVGGQFLDFNNTEKLSLARLQNSSAPRRSPFDFDGDGKTDISIFRPSGGEWWYQRSSDGQIPAVQFGASADRIVPGDYTGDGKTDIAFFRPSTAQWFILRSEDGSFFAFPFGSNGDIPAPADYDGDNKIDPAVFRPSNGAWYISKSTGGVRIEQFGLNGDIPVPSDYDGDGKSDIGVFRPSSGQWWISRSGSGLLAVTFGNETDKPVQGDYTGDGKADVAFWRPSTGQWFILRSENLSFYAAPFGSTGDIPAPGDYDGDGRFDFAVFRPSNAGWYVSRSASGLMIQQFGVSSDQPVASAFIP